MTKFISVCSGIEAASVAFTPLGWEPLAFSEIDPFPCFVLAEHYGAGRPRFMPDPDEAQDEEIRRDRLNAIRAVEKFPRWGNRVTNFGDFTRMRDDPMIIDADVLCGGTPCQAFSMAGNRQSLADDRGNLTLEFVRLADAIDDLRLPAGRPGVVTIWENVPGILSVKDNAFGCFLGALVGADAPIVLARGQRWTSSGLVAGPRRRAAWRVLDAQYFGLAQRRERVVVVSSPLDGPDPSEILFEPDGLRRYSPPSRETQQNPPASTVGRIALPNDGGDVSGPLGALAGGGLPHH